MSILEKIKADSLAARKAKDAVSATLLTTLYSEAAMKGKNANRETTDEEAIAVIKKFLKGVEETITHLKVSGGNAGVLLNAEQERSILESYLPVQLTELDLQKIVGTMAQTLDDRSPKQMGVLMKKLKEQYEGQYDGAIASKVIKAILA